MYFVFFFFFKQKTAYEMRISDWSSDVCSSDLWSGGVLIQALPASSDEMIRAVNDVKVKLRALPTLRTMLMEEGKSLEQIAEVLSAEPIPPNGMVSIPLAFHCRCSAKQLKRHLALLPATELSGLVSEDSIPPLRCQFCAKSYEVTRKDVEEMLAKKGC